MRSAPSIRAAGVLLSVGIALALAAGAAYLRFDPGYATFFDADDPQLQAFESVRADFAASDSLLLLLRPAAPLFSAAGMDELQQLTADAWQLPGVTRVDSLANWQVALARDDDVLVVPLVEAMAGDALRERVLADPLLVGRLVSEDGTVAAVAATVRYGEDQLSSGQTMVAAARALAARFKAEHPGAEVYVSGIVAMNHAFAEASLADSVRLVPLLFGAFALLLRSLLAMLACMVVVLLAVAGALGAAGWLGIVLTSPTAMAPIIVATLAIAHCVHVLRACATAGPGGRAAALAAVRGPVWLAAITTACGMLAFNGSEVPPFRDLGNILAAGVVLAALLSLTVLPALVARLPLRTWAVEAPLADVLTAAVARRAPWLLLAALLALLPAAWGLARLTPNDEFVRYFSPALPFRQAADFQAAHFGGLYDIEFRLAARGGSIDDPAYLQDLAHLCRWLRSQPEVRHAGCWSDLLADVNQAWAGGVPDAHRLPDDAAVAANLRTAFELSLPVGLSLLNLVQADASATRLQVLFGNLSSTEMLSLEARILDWLSVNAPHIEQRHGSINLMFSHIGQRNILAMLESTAIAIGVIGLLLALWLRSLALGVISVVTNTLPILLAFGIWGLSGADLTLTLSTAVAMTFGVVVDDTIHLLARFRRARREGMSALAAWHTALRHAGAAVTVTSIVLLAGFAVLALSSFLLNAHLAQITLLIVALALLVDLVLLPALLLVRAAPGR